MFATDAFLLQSSNTRFLAFLLSSALLIAGCAGRDVVLLPAMDDWDTRATVLGNASEWEFSGRIGVSAGDEGFNGKIRWTQTGNTFQATVSGPLGIGTVRVEGDGRSVVHTDKNGVRTELQNAEEELYYRYGWTIPVQSLRYWALGIPDPSVSAQTELNSDQQLAKLEQRDWTVSISRYRSSGGQSMPNLLSANNSNTRVRIVIDKWKFFD